MQTIIRHRSSVEYLSYSFDTFTVDGAPVAPPTVYELAAPPAGTQPTDWNPGPWLAGPMTPGRYDLYLRFTDTPEVPVRRVANIVVN